MVSALIRLSVNLLTRYNQFLLRPIHKTKMVPAGFTYFLADCISQNKIGKKDDYSLLRSSCQASLGAFSCMV